VEVTNTDGMRQSGTHNVARMPGGSHNEASTAVCSRETHFVTPG